MSQVPSTTPAALEEELEDDAQITIVDVRQPHEFERGHIEAAAAETINVPLQQLQTLSPERFLSDIPTDEVVTVCTSGSRSRMATQLFNQAGIDARNLQGGMRGWTRRFS
jgi:rhodanese-related sulfurtransferase